MLVSNHRGYQAKGVKRNVGEKLCWQMLEDLSYIIYPK